MVGKPEQTHCSKGAEVCQELWPICTQGSHKAATEFLLHILGIWNVVLTGKYEQMTYVSQRWQDQRGIPSIINEFEINNMILANKCSLYATYIYFAY